MALSTSVYYLKVYLVVCLKANAHKADYPMICVGPFYKLCKLMFAYFIHNHILENSGCGLKLHVMMCCLSVDCIINDCDCKLGNEIINSSTHEFIHNKIKLELSRCLNQPTNPENNHQIRMHCGVVLESLLT